MDDPLTETEPLFRREAAERREHERLSPLAAFADGHAARPAPEPDDPFRTVFVRDRDRVVHCGAFRRLKDKTQVFVIDEGDFYRTRLTHTLEVTQMARFLARALGLNEDLAEVLGLVHDIGHPPFGHEGERVLHDASGVPFDHNRQALRIVDVLEAPYPDRPGLNLTHAVRGSILKHGGDAGHGAPAWPGHLLEAQVSDLADSIAYLHHDLEDALRAGVLVEADAAPLGAWAEAAAQAGHLPPGRPRRKAILSRLLKSSLHDVVETSAARLATCDATDADDVARRGLRLVGFSPARAALHQELARFLHERFYRHHRVLRSAEVARQAIAAIVEHYRGHVDELPEAYRERVERDGLGRGVCDYVAGMTDRFAMEEWRRLSARRGVHFVTPEVEHAPENERAVALLEQRIGHRFKDPSLAVTALTHASARSDAQIPNERLEFLGDSVLGLLVAQELFERYPDRAEGELSRIKSSVVSRYALRTVARRWGLAELMNLGPGFRAGDGLPPSVVADAVEAVLGAVFLDAGLQPVRRLVDAEFSPLIRRSSDRARGSNHKSELQAFTQGQLGFTPHYSVLSEEGPDHEKVFTVAARVNGVELAVAKGRNKRQAEQRAARDALRRLRLGAGDLPAELRAPAGVAAGGDFDDAPEDDGDEP